MSASGENCSSCCVMAAIFSICVDISELNVQGEATTKPTTSLLLPHPAVSN